MPDATAAVVSGVSVDSTILQRQVALVGIDAAAMTVGASGVPADSAVVQCQAALLDTVSILYPVTKQSRRVLQAI